MLSYGILERDGESNGERMKEKLLTSKKEGEKKKLLCGSFLGLCIALLTCVLHLFKK